MHQSVSLAWLGVLFSSAFDAFGDHVKRELGKLIEIHLDGAQRRRGVRSAG